MLFNSYIFILLFLPITLSVFLWLNHRQYAMAVIIWLIASSFFFYAWWNPIYLILLVASIGFNYGLAHFMIRQPSIAKLLLITGVVANLSLLIYYKYANFFVNNFNWLANTDFQLSPIILPLAISFFTFQQITYLVDTYHNDSEDYSFWHYCLFVIFFPQLIAGPIVYHKEMLPQFTQKTFNQYQIEHLSVGLTIFFFGLFKKVILADNVAVYATPIFTMAEQGQAIDFFMAWQAALAYTLQLYFDFSGYSDMAVGLARLFGIVLPINFYSPYKSINIIEFWRRWHITLSRFLRYYLYIPLGGNRKTKLRRHSNLLITMLLGGLWHGAGWTFVLWGLLHGLYLIINHLWQAIIGKSTLRYWQRPFAVIFTFLWVCIAWVLFRAESVTGAWRIYQGMSGLQDFVLPEKIDAWLWICGLLFIVWFMPNVYQIMRLFNPVLPTYADFTIQNSYLTWQPTRKWAIILAVMATVTLLSLTRISEFLYFQF